MTLRLPELGHGPWQDEPDTAGWLSADGRPCWILRSETTGALGGYVILAHPHPWIGLSALEIPAFVRGGVTYSALNSVTGVWWIGFECSQAGDYAPLLDRFGAYRPGKLLVAAISSAPPAYRDFAYVRAETEGLARQAELAAQMRVFISDREVEA